MKTSFTGLFCRDSLADTGEPNEEGLDFTAPDMIFHAPVERHREHFRTPESYASDPNQPVQGDRDNHLYVRAFKRGPGAESGHFFAYATEASLVLRPDQWGDGIRDAEGRAGTALQETASGQIVVGDNPLIWRPAKPNTHYCLAGRIVTAARPNPLPRLSSWEELLRWVRTSPNICYRNLFIENNTGTTWSSLKRLSNIEDRPRRGLLLVSAGARVLPGTKVTVQCAPLGIDVGWSIQRGSPDKFIRVTLPPRFDGFVELRAQSPGIWPPGASFRVDFHLMTNREENLGEYEVPPARLAARGFVRAADEHDPIVHAGACTVVFQ